MAPAGSLCRSAPTNRNGVGLMLLALLALAAVVLFVLKGLNVAGKRFDPAYFGWACVVTVVLWAFLSKLGG